MQPLKRLLIAAALLPIAHAAQAAPFLYMPTYDVTGQFMELSVIDTADGSHAAAIYVRGADTVGGVRGMAFNPAGNRIYAASSVAISVIDAATNDIIAQVDIPGISRILLNPAGTLLYVETETDTRIVNTATNTVVGTSTLLAPYQLAAFSPDGTRLYRIREITTPTYSMSKLEVVDVATGTLITTYDVGYGSNAKGTYIGSGNHDIAVNLAGTHVYVMNGYSALSSEFNSVTVIDTANGVVAATIPVGNLPARIVANAAGTRLYVTVVFSEDNGVFTNHGHVTVIDTATNNVVDTIPLDEAPDYLALAPAGTLYVQSHRETGDAVISVIDSKCNSITSNISQTVLGGYFKEMFMAPATGPVTTPPVIPIHVQITGMEVTQGIQNLANAVPLYGGRRTFVRVYVKSDGPMVEGVTAILSAVGNIFCDPGSCPPSGSSLGTLVPVNTVGTRLKVGPNPKRYNINESFLFELPWEWTKYQSLHLLAAITQGPGLIPTQSCRNEVINGPLFMFEKGFDTLKVQFVRLSYRLPVLFNGNTNTLQQATTDDQAQSESYIRRTYPLSDLLPAPDYPIFDAGLGTAVARLLPQCLAAAPEDQNMCAHDYIAPRLDSLQATTGFMGNANAIYGLIPQVPNDTRSAFFPRGACCTGVAGAGPASANDYAAHEIGHFLGRQHPVPGSEVCGHSASDPDYPYFRAWIAPPFSDADTGLAGFDRGEPSLEIPRQMFPTLIFGSGTTGHFDIMGYCEPTWISDYTYVHLHACLEAMNGLPGVTPGCGVASDTRGPGSPQMGDWLTVFGNISPAHAAEFIAGRVDRNYAPPRAASGTHKIRLTDAAGATLAEYPFTPRKVDDAAESFGQVVPFVAGTQKIEIVDATGSTVIGQKAVSANAPAVSGVALQGAPDATTGLVTLAWNASDADGDALTYDVFFTRDLGGALQPLMLGLSEKSAQIDTSKLAGGSAQLRVVASDGVLTGFADTPVFTLANKPPKPRILSPGDGSTIHVGQLINLEGSANDSQDGVIGETHLAWSTGGHALGSGSKLSITNLPAGSSQISLTATNSVGLSATATASVTVIPNVDMPEPTLTAGPVQIGWHLAAGDSTLQTSPLQVANSGSGNLDFTAVSSAPWLTLSSSTGTTPATLTVTANPAGFAGGTTQDATITLTAAGTPSQTMQIPVTLSVGNTFVVARNSGAAVTPPEPADFAVAASVAAGSFAAGQSAQTTLTVTPSNGFHGIVALSCSGLPASATCNFSPATLDVGTAAANTTLTIATAARTAMNSIRGPINPLAPGGVIFAALCVPMALRRRRIADDARRVALLAFLCVGVIALHGCGGGGSGSAGQPPGGNPGGASGTPAGTYNVTITATSGATTHTVVYALTVN